MSSADLLEVADRVYAVPASEFIAVRDAEAKAVADKDLAKQVKTLRKPSVAAWAVNLLVRRESAQIDQVLGLAESLRAAAESLDGEELRTLTRQRRQLTAALTQTARELVREYDVRLTGAVADQVEGMLNAAMLDPVAAAVLRSGLVVTAFTATGVSELDVAAVCAVPEATGHQAVAVERKPPALHVVSDEPVRREQARERVHEATLARAAAELAVEEVAARIERDQARRLQLAGEIDELRRRIAVLEDEIDGVDDDLEEAESAQEEARLELEDAVAEHQDAEQALSDLG
ncbi:hypothetical protein [Nocardioides marmorisolisilvae]|uniref:Uncharacterized protein n=1 Tax=Nocardioides marmorisolisilvae TaxID=1542737 RepID=A0A3N0DW13_9ACTN|nr:hypothetical protein [Nocardioides marmorisolisilvae]RNL79761.1 hypothetical protein EFL95_12470 [Nocardioides marmorisolisilvae]